MRLSNSENLSNVAGSKRLVRLVAAFAAFRSVHGAGRRIPSGLRRQVLAALDAGVPAGAIGKACGVSWSQMRYWRSAGRAGGAVPEAAQVLSVVDHEMRPVSCPSPSSDGGLELRVGAWRISLNRVAD
jgi:hypothetical protein